MIEIVWTDGREQELCFWRAKDYTENPSAPESFVLISGQNVKPEVLDKITEKLANDLIDDLDELETYLNTHVRKPHERTN